MKTIRIALGTFIVLLLLSGITAFPLRTEIAWLSQLTHLMPPSLALWVNKVNAAIAGTPDLILYGTDWLAFGHIVIALFFIPVYRDPVRYEANLRMGMVACIGVLPLAFICGPIRGIPFFHQLIDCAFGVFGLFLLWIIQRRIKSLTIKNNKTQTI